MARDYSPQIGRYMESDPLGLYAALNTYSYVESMPLNLVDIDGLMVCEGQWRRKHFHVGRVGQMVAASCICYWLCEPCRGQVVWSGNPFELPSTVGRTFVDHSSAVSPATGTGGGAAGRVRSNGEYRRGTGGGGAGGGYNCLCPQKPGPEIGCRTCYPDSRSTNSSHQDPEGL